MCSEPAPHERCDPNPAVSSTTRTAIYYTSDRGAAPRPNLHRNSRPAIATIVSRPGHPCVCGEQRRPLNELFQVLGASLRVRGTDSRVAERALEDRVIPACAGNSRFVAV